jgi:ABC-type Fe3+-citrate transport system substrate-binding protein
MRICQKLLRCNVLKDAYADWRQTLRTIASLVGKSELADQKLADYEEKVSVVKEHIASAAEGKTVSIVWPDEKQAMLIGCNFLSGKLLYGKSSRQRNKSMSTKDRQVTGLIVAIWRI